ncbi:centromere kinetochore component CENP-T-domain-containing protein [Phyllosticta citrichinensis]|uniref:Centromere kinetochore component CENP-T-domain-containing protein n=1 Tax=Phyllosticta citrichinensis TaxID=1130410 RepID=A0ABR1XIT8_9PEZI
MTEPPSKKSRASPRKSEAHQATAGDQDTTPYSNLRQLSQSLRQPSNATPRRRATSADPTPGRTPRTQQRTPRARQFPVPRRVGPPTTPHAIRALRARRDAALAASGGRNRRRSGVQQRETPRDFLRALSRRLAGTSEPVQPSPSVDTRGIRPRDHDLEDEPDLPRPRLSMPLHEDEDDSFHEAPPRLSLALDEADVDATQTSVEGGRRAYSEDPIRPRLSRTSFGRLRLSERFGDLDALGEEELAEDDATFAFGDAGQDVLDEETRRFDDENTTQELRNLLASRRRSRASDINIPGGEDSDDEPTFRFAIPPARRSLLPNLNRDSGGREDDIQEQDEATTAGADLSDDEPEPALELDDQEEALDSDAAETSPSRLRQASPPVGEQTKKRSRTKTLPVSRFGHEYPSLPSSVVKRLATSFARVHGGPSAKLSQDTLNAIATASDWYFEQAGEDLASYASHAGRKTIDEADVVMLMKRQRKLGPSTTPFSLAQKYLPRELLQNVRMPARAAPKRKPRKRKLDTIDEGDEATQL